MTNDKPLDGQDTPQPNDETQPIGAGAAESTVTPTAQPAAEPTAEPAAAQAAAQAAEPPQQRFEDRLWGLKSMIAVALAAVILGGLGGAAIAKAGEGGDQRGGFGPGGRHGDLGNHLGARGGRRGGLGQNGPQGDLGQPGVVPPTSPATPSSPSTTS